MVMPKSNGRSCRRQSGHASREPTRMGETGGIQRREAAIHLSNLMLVDPTTNERPRWLPGSGGRPQVASPEDRRRDRKLRRER